MNDNIQRLRAIMDLQDDIILTTDGENLEYINETFFKFSKFENFEEFKEFHKCICDLFIDMGVDNYLKPVYQEGNWITHLQKNPSKEFFVAMKSAKGIRTPFRVKFKQLDTTTEVYVITLHNAALSKENLDFINLISNIESVYFSVTNMSGEIIKFSQSLLKILKIDDFEEGKYSVIELVNEKDRKLVMQHISKNDSTPYEISLRYNKVTIPVMVQGYFGVINNSPVRFAVLVDLRELKELQKEAKRKDFFVFQQAKMAQMGEMINMIAHQWRQPLNAISAASIQSTMKLELGQFNNDEFLKTQTFVQEQCQKMSQVINTFMEYASTKQKKENFLFSNTLGIVLKLVKEQFNAHNIKIDIENNNIFEIFGSRDMFEQIILNILMNARDAYDERKDTKDKVIYIKTKKNNTIQIMDFAGGIDNKYIEKIFMPYFTTKEQRKGAGLGLYMSKRIMQEHFKGDLHYEELENGSKFILDFGIKE